jgi:Beta-propeller repeat
MEVRVRFFYLFIASMCLVPTSPAVSGAVRAKSQEQTTQVAPARHPRLPLWFEANQGQASADTDFLAHGPGYNLFLSQKGMTLALESGNSAKEGRNSIHDAIAIQMMDSDQECRPRGVQELNSKINYLIGKDASKWQIGVRSYGKVKYEALYPGIDLVFYGSAEQIEYDFIVHPGADISRIRFSLKTGGGAVVDGQGALALKTKAGTIRFKAPLIYQDAAGVRQNRQGHFLLTGSKNSGERIVSFEVASYDHSKPLIIDPVLDYSTYLGGTAYDYATGVAVDNAGNAYIAGTTSSLDFPVTPGAVFPVHGGCSGSCYDAFVAKINTTGGGLIYATYLGGAGDDFGYAIAIDPAGNAYVTGSTNSTDFPTTGKALQRSCGGTCFSNDAFVAKLNASGSALLYSTYLGGSGEDAGTGIAFKNGKTYVSGYSGSTDFPTTAGVYQATMQGQGSSFVAELNANASAFLFSTFLGEVDLFDSGGSLAVDAAGNISVAGTTLSSTFPVTTGAFHTAFQSGLSSNMYILKLNPTGSALVYSAMIGGAAPAGIALDSGGNTYVVASAGSFSPVTPGAVDQSCDNGMLILKLDPTGAQLLTAAHICPAGLFPAGVAVDSSHNIIFSGYTDSPSLPTTVGSMRLRIASPCCSSDAVLGKLKADGSALMYLSYFGGSSGDNTNALATDSSGNIYMAGGTSSTNLPVENAFQTNNAGSIDAFLAKVTLPQPKISVSPAVLNFDPAGVGNSSPSLQVDVANLGTSSIPVSAVVASGDFAATSSCGTEILPGSRCSISVGFKPQAVGNRTGNLSLTDGFGVQNVALAGIGVSGPLLSVASVYQIYAAANTISPPVPVAVTNLGTRALVITSFGLSNAGVFGFGAITCLRSLAPLASCTVNVTFNGQFGTQEALLSFTDNEKGSPQSIELIGTEIGQGLIFTTSGVRFGQQTAATKSSPQKVTLMNGTGAALTISSIRASANFAQANNCGTSLAAGAYCTVTVGFLPASLGIKQGTISVVNSSSASPVVLPLIGTGD